jgi:DNA modification methylase
MKIKTVKIEEAIPYVRNPRQNKAAIAKVSASLKEFGWQQPIVVDKDMVVIAGHTRLEAARTLGMDKVPVQIAEDLTDAQVKAYRIADNRVSQEAEWDLDLLRLELSDLDNLDYDLLLTGFDDDELNGMLTEAVEGFTDEDDVPELPDEPVSVLGDIWTLGNHRLMCGDSTSVDAVDKLMDGNKADMVFTDPPYGLDYSGGRTQLTKEHHRKIENDDINKNDLGNLIELAFIAKKDNADVYVCVSPLIQSPFMQMFEKYKADIDAVIVWDKKNAGLGYMAYRRQCEFILFHKGSPFCKGDKSDFDLWSFSKDATTEYMHPTQKPVALSERAISNSSKQGEKVLDLFGGSGSTLLACEKNNRFAYLMELDLRFCDVIIKRWQDFTGREAVHAETGKTYNEMKAERDGGK